jgi:hypothetical protein
LIFSIGAYEYVDILICPREFIDALSIAKLDKNGNKGFSPKKACIINIAWS